MSSRLTNVRSQILSLRNISKDNNDFFAHLDLSIQRHNQIEDPEVTESVLKDDNNPSPSFKLWGYFLQQAESLGSKLEHERVKGWLKIVQTILRETDKKIKANQEHIEQLNAMIRNKYKQTHSLFKQIEALKRGNSQERKSRRKRDLIDTGYLEKVKIIQETIGSLNEEIAEQTEQCQKIEQQVRKMKSERKNLLTSLLQNGYYMPEGAIWILVRMSAYGIEPVSSYFPAFLDERSKSYLLRLLEQSKQQSAEQKSMGKPRSLRARSTSELSQLAKKDNFSDIYKGTKQYLMDLLKRKQWEEPVRLPKIQQTMTLAPHTDWKTIQRKRVQAAYSPEQAALAKKIQFGIRLDTHFP